MRIFLPPSCAFPATDSDNNPSGVSPSWSARVKSLSAILHMRSFLHLPIAFILLVAVIHATSAATIVAHDAIHSAPTGLVVNLKQMPVETARISFVIAGDVIPHQPVKDAAAANIQQPIADTNGKTSSATLNHKGWDSLFIDIRDVFQRADFGFLNLETPIAPQHDRGSKAFQFNAPPDLLGALATSGVKVVSFANNHVFDQGYAGFSETLSQLRSAGLLFVGAGNDSDSAWTPVLLEKNGIRVGVLGMTRLLNGNRNPGGAKTPQAAFVPYHGDSAPGVSTDYVIDRVKAARAQCDLLLVSIHWGVEYAAEPRKDDIELAHAILEAGATLIIGHHPHVLQPVETYISSDGHEGFIFYSLGNFVSNQARNYLHGITPEKTGEMRDSIIGQFSVVRRDYGQAGSRVELADLGIMPVWTENNHPFVKGGAHQSQIIRPVLIDRELPAAQVRVAELMKVEKPDVATSKALVSSLKRVELLRRRRELLLYRTGDEYLVAPPAITP